VESKAARIRALNDTFRQTFIGGRVVITPGVQGLTPELQAELLGKVRGFTAFAASNDPYGEHDFGCVEVEGEKFFWKIDCYDQNLEFGSEDPSDPIKTSRVLTIMCADEY
jgi:hypothetical protein